MVRHVSMRCMRLCMCMCMYPNIQACVYVAYICLGCLYVYILYRKPPKGKTNIQPDSQAREPITFASRGKIKMHLCQGTYTNVYLHEYIRIYLSMYIFISLLLKRKANQNSALTRGI